MKYTNRLLSCVLILFQLACLAEDENKIKVNISGLDLATLARQVERVTKKSFLFDENTLRNVRVTIQSDTSISSAEFYRVFQTVCQMNDLVLIPVEGAGINLEKIVRSASALKEPGVHPVLVSGEELPKSDALVSYLIKLKSSAPTKVLAAITPSLSSTGSAVQIPNTDLLMINDVASSLKRVEKIISLLDVPGEPVSTVSISVANMTVDKAQAMLTEYLQALSKAGGGETGKDRLAMVKDERLNVIHLIGPQKDVENARSFLKTIDLESPSAARTIRYYKLKNVPVKDIVEYVSTLLGAALNARASEAQASTSEAIPTQTPGHPVAPITPQTGIPPAATTTPATTKPIISKAADKSKTTSPAAAAPEIIPVEGLNTLVVSGDASVHKEVEAILANLDKRKGQVLMEAAIVQVTGDDSLDLGAEFLSINGATGKVQEDAGTGFGLGTQSEGGNSTTTTGTGSTTTANLLRGFPTQTALSSFAGGAFRFVDTGNIQAIVKLLSTKSNVSIVSQPLLLVNDNEEASFTTKVSEPTTTTSQGTATTNVSFNGFADATTSLKITPHISPGGFLNLEIVQTVEEFTGSAPAAGVPPPKVSNNATTKVMIPDRQTIVIGGFTRDSSTISKSGIPGLMQIPGIGKAFSHENKKKTVSRLYLFVRPKILTTDGFEDLKLESEQKKDDVERVSKKSNIKKEIKERIGRAEVVPVDEPAAEKGGEKAHE